MIYKDEMGICYSSKLHKWLGIASPSLNLAHGGMNAVRKKACQNAAKRATLVQKWKIRYLRRIGENVIFLGYAEKDGKRYAVWAHEGGDLITETRRGISK